MARTIDEIKRVRPGSDFTVSTPFEQVADTGEKLPGQVRLAGADIGIVGDVPVITKHEDALDADDTVPEIINP